MALVDRIADATEDGTRVDALLAAWTGATRGQVQNWIAAGVVRVDGATVAKSHRVAAGERVVAGEPPAEPQPIAPPPVPIRYEDAHLAVVAKPAGLVVHVGAGTRDTATLVDALRAMGVTLAAGDDPARPGIVHRLDRGTSGLLVVAKTEQARQGLITTFKRHHVDRRYWAIVDGEPQPASATIDAPIGRSGRNRTKFTVAAEGRRAVTHYDVTAAFGRACVLSVRLETGRTHQVRVHMAAVGHPVSGDTAYGASAAVARELALSRPALHARHLGFDHPVTGERVAVDEDLPDDLAAAHERLRQLRDARSS